MQATVPKQPWKIGHTVVALALLAGIIAVGLLVPATSALRAWLAILGLLTTFTVVAGHGVTGRTLGCLIDDRNKMSLARLQMILWTLLVLSALLAAALIRVRNGVEDPLLIAVPEQLWVIMGISVTSLVGSPLILSAKKDKEPRQDERDKTIAKLEDQGETTANDGVDNIGQVIIKSDLTQASVSDLFKGDQTSNAAQLDLGKVQMFYFTLALVIAYGAQLGSLFSAGSGFADMPELSSSMVALLGISHAGYLANKAAPS